MRELGQLEPHRVDQIQHDCLKTQHLLYTLWSTENSKIVFVITTVRFNALFPDGPQLASTRMSPFWILLELRMMEMVVTSGVIRCAKLSQNGHHQQTNIQFFTGLMPFLLANQQCHSTDRNCFCNKLLQNLVHISVYLLLVGQKNWGHFVLRLVTLEILIRSASNLAQIKVISFLTLNHNIFESSSEK